MNIEEEIFKKCTLNETNLIKYGFIKEKKWYKYKISLDSFLVEITIINNKVKGKIYDLESESEYTNYRVKDIQGSFALDIKEKYIKILKDIKDKCFDKNYFMYSQSNRITNLIIKKYKITPKFLWEKSPGYGVFKGVNDKWFAIIMNINKNKIISNEDKEVEIINVKLNDTSYLKEKGIYKGYHMNKQTWFTIILDDSLTDEKIMELIDISYKLSNLKDEWILPANIKYFDVISYIDSMKIFSWKEPKSIKLNDIVYIYLGSPYSAIMYKCKVKELNIYNDLNDRVMNLEMIEKFNTNKFPFKKLKEYGLNSVRSPRRIPTKLSEFLKDETT